MRELISVWRKHIQDFYEYKEMCGFSYKSNEKVLAQFDKYYANLGVKELQYSREIIEPFLYLAPNERINTYYSRNLIVNENNTIKLNILRIKCLSCYKTHAVISSFIIPHRRHNLNSIINFIKDMFLNSLSFLELFNNYPLVFVN